MIPSKQIPLGTRIPPQLHSVSVSLPTMSDVIGYEERDPAILAQMNTGYPRFVKHAFLRQIESYWQTLFDCPGQPIWLAATERSARQLQEHLDCPDSKFLKHQGVSGVRIPKDETLNQKAKLFLQHTGGYLCSREAEDYLVANELINAPGAENAYCGDAQAKILDFLQPLLNASAPEDIVLSNSGMNAIYAVFEAINAIQQPRGRHAWIKLGWLYVDTMHILDKLSPVHDSSHSLYDVFDVAGLEALLKSQPNTFAGIITEAPTNPLIQTMDLERIHALAHQHGAYFVVDPTTASPANVDVTPYADIVVNSLTKYAANEGDLIAGAIVPTASCPDRSTVLDEIRARVNPPYERVLANLARQIDGYLPLVETVNASTRQIVDYLERHPKVRKVHWAKEAASKTHFEKIARTPESIGGIISFDLEGELAPFYDRLLLAKGPSFGMAHTLVCPFMYLAHYDLVSTPSGRATLKNAGINPELVRFSIGSEPVDEIIAALEHALD